MKSLGNSKKRPTTAVVAGAKNLRALQQNASKSRLDSANKFSSINNNGMKSIMNTNNNTR